MVYNIRPCHVPFPFVKRHAERPAQLQPFAGIDLLVDLSLFDLAVHALIDTIFLCETCIAAVVPFACLGKGGKHFLF